MPLRPAASNEDPLAEWRFRCPVRARLEAESGDVLLYLGLDRDILYAQWPGEAHPDMARFDAEGRLVDFRKGPHHWHTTLDLRLWGHETVGKGRSRRLRPRPSPADPLGIIAGVHRSLHQALTAAEATRPDADIDAAALAELHALARRAGDWTAARLAEDREAVRRLYLPVPVLPPDQYAALVVQLSEGCPWDRCRFCDLYRDRPYRLRPPDEVRAHLGAVLAWLGRSVERFDRVFLDQANALLAPTEQLIEVLDEIRERLGGRRRAVSGFLDAFHRPRPGAQWAALHRHGLTRVYVGLESGSEEILHALGKPLRIEQALQTVEAVHAGSISVGVILLVGAGGPEEEPRHREASAAVVERLRLRRGDQVYLSPLVDREHRPLPGATPAAAGRLRAALRERLPRTVPIATYDLPMLAARSPRL